MNELEIIKVIFYIGLVMPFVTVIVSVLYHIQN